MEAKRRIAILLALTAASVWAAVTTSFAPPSWIVISLCVWTAIFTFRGWRQMDTWEQSLCFWGIFSIFTFSHFLVSDPTFNGWGDLYFFCSGPQGGLSYCLPSTRRTAAFRWNLRGWRKAVAMWNFFLSSAVGVQRLSVEIGLGGLLLGEESISRASLLSVAWRLIPFMFNRWESTFGAECSSILFELPHFATELLVVLPLTQLLAGRLRIVGNPHLRVDNNARRRQQQHMQDVGREAGAAAADDLHVAAPAAAAAGAGLGARAAAAAGENNNNNNELDDDMVPNVLGVRWQRDSRQRRFLPRLRANLRVMALIVFITAVASLNALLVPLHLERRATSDPRAATIAGFETELSALVDAGRRADATQTMMQRVHASTSKTLAASPTLSSSLGGCMASGNCTGALHDRLAEILAGGGSNSSDKADSKKEQQNNEEGWQNDGAVEWLVPAHWVIRLVEDAHTEHMLQTAEGDSEYTKQGGGDTADGSSSSSGGGLFARLFGRAGGTSTTTTNNNNGDVSQPASRRKKDFKLARSSGGINRNTFHHQGVAYPILGKKEYDIDRMVALLLPQEALSPSPSCEATDEDSSCSGSTSSSLASESEYEGLRRLQRGFKSSAVAYYGPRRLINHPASTLAPLYRNLAKHADELRRMRDPEHRALVPLVEAALTIMRLSCERWFALVGVYLLYLLFRDPPPAACAVVRFIARLSRLFHRAILLSFPGVCWAYGAGFLFSSFASVVFWSAPILRAVERLRSVASEVEPEDWHTATTEEVERMGGTCPICWGSLARDGNDDGNGDVGSNDNDEGAADAAARLPASGLPCGHAYHRKCLQEWLMSCHVQSRQPRCPMCQAHVPVNVRWRVPLTGGGGAGAGGDMGGAQAQQPADAHVGADAHNEHAGAAGANLHRQRGIPGIDALVDDLRDEFRHRFEMPMPRVEQIDAMDEVAAAIIDAQIQALRDGGAGAGGDASANVNAAGAGGGSSRSSSESEALLAHVNDDEHVAAAGEAPPRQQVRRRGLFRRLIGRQ